MIKQIKVQNFTLHNLICTYGGVRQWETNSALLLMQVLSANAICIFSVIHKPHRLLTH